MVTAFLETVFSIDFFTKVTAWFIDGVLSCFSPSRRTQIRSRWETQGPLHKYTQILSWLLAFVTLAGLGVFVWAAFTLR